MSASCPVNVKATAKVTGKSRILTRDDNGSHFLTRNPRHPSVNSPMTRDYSRVCRVMTPDYCSFQSWPLSWSALKIKHRHCHKILSRNKWIKLCRKSVQCLIKTKSWVNGSRVYTDPWPTWPTQICWPTWPVTRDPLTHCHLCSEPLITQTNTCGFATKRLVWGRGEYCNGIKCFFSILYVVCVLYYMGQTATTTAVTVTAEATVTQPGLLVHHTTYHA